MATENTTKLQILEALSYLHPMGDVVELRIPKLRNGGVLTGYFTDYSLLAETALKFDGKCDGIYITLNTLEPATLARAANRYIVARGRVQTTSDSDVIRRCWLPIDVDPQRPSGVSSSDKEHQESFNVALEIKDWLSEHGFPEPIIADSGNGAHLLYRIDLPNDESCRELIRLCLETIALLTEDKPAKVDKTVFNASRIWKLYGTTAAKGENLPDRPHRKSSIILVPEKIEVVPLKALQKIAAKLSRPKQRNGYRFNVPDTIRRWGLQISKTKNWNGHTLYELETCPFDANHRRTARIIDFGDSAAFACFHNSCASYRWRDLVERMGGYAPPKKSNGKPLPPPVTVSSDSEKQTDAAQSLLIYTSHRESALRVLERFGKELGYSEIHSRWWTWTGKIWTLGKDSGITDKIAQSLDMDKEYIRANCDVPDIADKLIAKLNGAAHRDGIERWLRGMVALDDYQFDLQPTLLNCQNGVVDLETGKLHQHSPSFMMTRITNASYNPEAKCQFWLDFLNVIFEGNEELIRFVQKSLGYSITGDRSERCIFIAWGTGMNGKSTLLESVHQVVGDYMLKTPSDTILSSKTQGIPNDVAHLARRRIVYCSESSSQRWLSESRVKELTGDNVMRARFLYGEWHDVFITFKIWLMTNNKPRLSPNDEAIWDRIRLVPFNVRIPPDKRMPITKIRELVKEESSGILNWLIEGYKMWREEGIGTCTVVADATRQYRVENDPVERFIEEMCQVVQDGREKGETLFKAYDQWAKDFNEIPLRRQDFYRSLELKGFQKITMHGHCTGWRGIRLLDDNIIEI